ncbi:Heat shock protein HslJ [Sphingobacterium nematocida]|uniref:Heat shock protein HslJ n=1 Tax=Sphingobacterium nematocida TaxID=1513896 RepID=A0A1T5FX41_9SPHI|nr:META domain-containing protein [Sphingobacterium nematocida]SKC00702.1 Heat shock protein HslJ [Sphingobacterium nematocida]
MRLSFITLKNNIFVFMAIISLGISSCGLSKTGSKEKPDMTAGLYNTTWKLTELNGKPVPDKVNGKEPFMSFDKEQNRYNASGGCNGIGGTFEVKSNKIKFSQGMSTMMACPDMSIEQGIGQMVGKVDNFELKEGMLILNQGKTALAKMTVSQTIDKKASLKGTWELDYVLNTGETFQALYPEGKPTITFEPAENKVNGNNSCNNFFGSYTSGEGNRIQFGALGSTRKFCPGNGESVFMKNMEKVTRYAIDDNGLTFISDDIVVMHFKKK